MKFDRRKRNCSRSSIMLTIRAMKSMHRAAATIALGCISLSAVAESGVGPKEIVIGSCFGMTGAFQALGTRQIEGAKAYLGDVNDKGGVLGRKIRIIEGDDRSEPDGAIECFKKTLVEGGAFAGAFFVGAVAGGKHVSMAEVNKIPVTGWLTGA